MKIDLREFNGMLRDYLRSKGIEHFSSVVSYEGEDIKTIMIIPRREGEEVTSESVDISAGQGMEQECNERLSV